jgi:hypothetical protein
MVKVLVSDAQRTIGAPVPVFSAIAAFVVVGAGLFAAGMMFAGGH